MAAQVTAPAGRSQGSRGPGSHMQAPSLLGMREALRWEAEQPELDDGELRLRPWRLEDADAVYDACQDVQIQRYTTVPVPYLHEHAVHFVQVVGPAGYTERTSAGFAVIDRRSAILVGACGLVTIDLAGSTGYAGYWIAPSSRGRHAASRAVRLLTEWGLTRLGLHAIRLEIEPENLASVSAARRAGFTPLPGPPVQRAHRGQLRDFTLFERTR
ncbi:MAG: hypothetical protein NVS3B26_27620 [Mycobacteriales bacterium]